MVYSIQDMEYLRAQQTFTKRNGIMNAIEKTHVIIFVNSSS